MGENTAQTVDPAWPLAVPYYRVSTDDKGQDPRRQAVRVTGWAAAEKVRLTEPVVDEGTSADKTDPFKRPLFQLAIQRAKELGAVAIVVEDPDRFTRKGTKRHFYFKTKLEEEHRLKLWIADRSIEAQEANEGELMESVKAYIAKQNNDNHRRRVKEGMERARARGHKFGQPPKTFTKPELDLVAKMRDRGVGWETIATAVSRARGAFDAADPRTRRKRSVSAKTLKNAWERRAALSEVTLTGSNPVATGGA